jgi:hypothetical protein
VALEFSAARPVDQLTGLGPGQTNTPMPSSSSH